MGSQTHRVGDEPLGEHWVGGDPADLSRSHTGKATPTSMARFWERMLVKHREDEARLQVAWMVGVQGADVMDGWLLVVRGAGVLIVTNNKS